MGGQIDRVAVSKSLATTTWTTKRSLVETAGALSVKVCELAPPPLLEFVLCPPTAIESAKSVWTAPDWLPVAVTVYVATNQLGRLNS